MALPGLGGKFRQVIQAANDHGVEGGISPYSGSVVEHRSQEHTRSFEAKLDRLPFSQSGFLKPLAARLFGLTKPPSPDQASNLTETQEKLLQGMMSVETAAAELSLLKTVEASSLDATQAEALLAYREDLTARAEGLESRLSDKLIELEDRISHQTDLLSGNEEENEGLSEVEAELDVLEVDRSELEEELESLVTFQEGLGLLEAGEREVLLEEMTGTASDLLELEAKYLQRDWNRALEAIREQAPGFLEIPHIQAKLLSLGSPCLEGIETLILLQAQAELWAVTEARIDQFGEMMKVSGMTDGIVNLGGLKKVELTYAQEYSGRQADYTKVLRYLSEGKAAEALELFQGLENSEETRILFETFKEAETINACTVNALTVVGAGAAARLAMPVIRGLALMGNVSSKAIPALQFAGQVGTFTLAHRQMNGWVMDQAFFDPNLSPIQNAEALSQEFLFNAGMFAFLGMSQKLFAAVEGKALQGLAKRKGSQASLKTYGPMTIEAEAASELFLKGLQKSQLTKLAHVGGSFGTELVGFGAWDYLAANLQSLANGDYDAKRIFTETLGSKDKWEHNLVFIAALKAGGALAAPVFRPMNRAAEGFAKAKYRDRLAELDQTARDCARALEGQLEDPQGSLELLARYEASLESKLSFLRDIPSELSHPAGLELLNVEIRNVRELSRAIRAGVFDTAANDGEYPNPILRIGKVLEPSEQAANEGNYGLQEAGLMPMAVGAEVFEVGENVTKPHPAPSPEVLEAGLRVFNMAEGGEPSGPGLLGRMGARIRRFFTKEASPALPIREAQVQAEQPREVEIVILPAIPETKLERPTTVSIPGGIRATGAPDIRSNPVQWREVATFEMATRAVTNEEVETYANDYRDYPLGLIWGDGERYHLIARGEAWDGKREARAQSLLDKMFEGLAKYPLNERERRISQIAEHPVLAELLDTVRKRHPRAPIFQLDEVQKRATDLSRMGEEHVEYLVFWDLLESFGLEPSFEGLCLFFKGLQERGYLKGFSFESERVVPELGSRKLDAGFNGLEQAATKINWYESVGIANAMGGRLPTEWEQEVAARGPAVRMEANSNLEHFENFYVGEVQTETAPLNDHAEVREMIWRGMEVFGYRRHGTASGGLSQQEAWYEQNTLPERADWGPVNGYGLHGMVGGVWEWAGNNYDTKNPWRSLRGGSWIDSRPGSLRAAFRDDDRPDGRSGDVGSRVVVAPQDSKVK